MKQIFTTLLLFVGLLAFGQVNDFYLPTKAGNALKVTQVDNNRFVIVGRSNDGAYAYKVNRLGQPVKIKYFRNIVGGTWSEFTDMVMLNGSYYMIGACDNCVANDPNRKIVIVKTDQEFKTLKVTKLSTPAGAGDDKILGWSKVEKDGNNIVIMSQLAQLGSFTSSGTQDTTTNFALTKVDSDVNVQFHRFYDYSKFDNIGDLKVHNGKYYAMAWNPNYGLNQPLYGIGMEKTYLHRIDPATGGVEATVEYDGVGLVLSEIKGSTDLAIGGAETVNLATGPQASVRRINIATGVVMASNKFGGNGVVDAIVELQPTDDGNLIASGAMNMAYPNLNSLLNSSITSFSQLVNPKDARIYRFNGQTLAQIGNERILPTDYASMNIMAYSLLPLSSDGIYFMAVGYKFKNASFYSYLPTPACDPKQMDIVKDQAGQRDELTDDSAFTTALYPNPASAFEGAWLDVNGTVENTVYVRVYDAAGKLTRQTRVNEAGRYQILTGQTGFFNVVVFDKTGVLSNYRLIVQ